MSTKDTESISIIPASFEDAAALSKIGGETFSAKFGHLYSKENLDHFVRVDHGIEQYQTFLSDPDYGVWKAITASGDIIGYAVAATVCGLPVDNPPPKSGEIKRLYLDEDWQGHRLGDKLMKAMMDWLHADGPLPLYLSVYKYNDGAQRFYNRYGFSHHKTYEFMVGDHADPEYIFVRS